MTAIDQIATPAGTMAVHTEAARVPQGAVVVVHDEHGLDDHARSAVARLARSGFLALAPDLFYRAKGSETITRDTVLDDVDAVLAALHDDGWSDEQIGVVGYGLGGGVAFVVAAERELGAAASLYPVGINAGQPRLAVLPHDAEQLKTPWLGQFGARDETQSSAQVDELESLFGRRGQVFSEIIRLRNGGHGFDRATSAGYAADAAFEAWERVVEWLDRRLEPPPTELAMRRS